MIKKEWLEQAPSLDEMLEYTQGEPTRRKKVLVGIPVYNEKVYLLEQLRRLAAQTNTGFDVLVAISPLLEADELEKEIKKAGLKLPFSVIWAKRKKDYGSAGGFYVLERYAMEKEYDILIEADVDCLCGPDTVALLAGKIEEGFDVVMPRTHKGKRIAYNPRFYSAIRTATLRKSGVTFLPFFYWSEDVELMERIERSVARITALDDCAVEHPFKLPFLPLFPSRTLYYRTRNYLMALTKFSGHEKGFARLVTAVYQWYVYLLSTLTLTVTHNSRARALREGIADAVKGDLKTAFSKTWEEEKPRATVWKPELIVVGGESGESDALAQKYAVPIVRFPAREGVWKDPFGIVQDKLQLLRLTGKRVYIAGSGCAEWIVPWLCLFPRSAAYLQGNEMVEVKPAGSFLSWMMQTGIACILSLALPAATVALVLLAMVWKPDIRTEGYGISGGKEI